MEIHELNTFSGTLGSSDYFATDNGNDTSKVSAQELFAPLNARIDNIIAGGDAPSAAEIVDARLGAEVLGSKTYASLGAAIRGQVTDLSDDLSDDLSVLKSEIKEICDAVQLYIPQLAIGTSPADSQMNRILAPIAIEYGHSYIYSIKYATASSRVSYIYFIDENNNIISSVTVPAGTTEASQSFTVGSDMNNCAIAINSAGNALDYEVSFADINALGKTYTEKKNIGKTSNLEMTSTNLVTPASGQPKRVTIWFPVVQGVKYTVDKVYRTQYFRIGYTTDKPVNGSAISHYEVLSSMTNHISFVAVQNGYACMKIYQENVDTAVSYSALINACVAYEGDYNSTVTQNAIRLKNLDGQTFYCGATRTLKTLKAGIEEATKYMDSTLYVDAGIYDLVEEFGSAWFEGLTSLDTLSGLMLKNRIHIVFSPNSKVVSHYTGNNQYALSLYSPFNAGEYGFTLENLNLDCSRCRYAVHDERNGYPEQYKSHFINCKMKIDNSNNSAWQARHCIGGGLGSNAEVIVENSVFESDDAANRSAVYYHIPNNATDDYRSVVTIKDNYFVTGCITLDDVAGTPASESDNSEYLISNNSMPVKYDGTDSQGVFNALTKSANVRAWNNEIRN